MPRYRATHGALALAAALLAPGCLAPQSLSLHPLFEDEQLVTVPRIAGTWEEQEEEDGDGTPVVLTFRPLERSIHEMTVTQDGKAESGTLLVGFGRLGESLFWNLTAQPAKDEGDLWSLHRLQVHSFARVTLGDDRLEVSVLRAKWLEKALGEGWVEMGHAWLDDVPILTGTTSELQHLLADWADDAAFEETVVFLRRVGGPSGNVVDPPGFSPRSANGSVQVDTEDGP